MSTIMDKIYDDMERYESLCKHLGEEPRNGVFQRGQFYKHEKQLMKMNGLKYSLDGYAEIDFFDEFSNSMKKEIEENSHKGNWKHFAIKENRLEILQEIKHHLNKLELSVLNNNEKEIKEYSSDLGNISMFMFKTTY